MVREGDVVAIFHSVHRVMKAEKVLKKAGIEVMLIPAPRQLSSDCGLALRYPPSEMERVEAALAANHLPPASEIYRLRNGEFVSAPPEAS